MSISTEGNKIQQPDPDGDSQNQFGSSDVHWQGSKGHNVLFSEPSLQCASGWVSGITPLRPSPAMAELSLGKYSSSSRNSDASLARGAGAG